MVTVTAVKRRLPETVLLDWSTALPNMNTGAISLADLRVALGDPTLGDNSTMRARIAVTDFGGTRGKGLSITLPDSAQGVVFQPKLSIPFDEGYLSYDVRWRSPFPWGFGGKVPGLAGCDDQLTNPPAGQSPSPHGWGGRSMWLADDQGGQPVNKIEWIGYKYWPGQTPATFGINMSTNHELGDEGGTSDGTWWSAKKYTRMNTSFVTNTLIDPATLVQGTHYLNDGLWEEYINGTRVGNFTNQVLRFYQPAKHTHMQFSCFYGGDDTWSGGGGIVDLALMKIVKVK